jgi:EmrB/QacA subfamily drug resistance transporter
MPERRWWTLVAVCAGIFMLLLDISIVNVALPDFGRDLGASFSQLQWVIDAYALSLAALLLICGSLGDLLGHRLTFLAGVVVFTLSSLLCGLSQSADFLIACRALQGVGGAAMFASSLALLAHEFRGRDRGVAFGAWGAVAGAAVAAGPLIGGALTSGVSWRWIFLVNVPIGALVLVVLVTRVRETPRRPGVRPDWLGFVTLSGGLLGIVYGLIRGNAEGWGSARIVAALAGGAVLLVAFLVVEATRPQPMLDLRLFRTPSIVGVSIAALAISAGLFSMFLYLTLYLQNILRYSAFQTGLRFLPLTGMVLVAAPLGGRLTGRVPMRALIAGGLGLVAIGLALMTRVDASSGWTALLPGMLVAGFGSGLMNPPLGATSVGTVGSDRAGIGSGINNTFRQVGIAVGIAALGAVFQSQVPDAFVSHRSAAGAAAARAAFVAGLDHILWIGAGITAAGAILSALLIRQRDLTEEASAPERDRLGPRQRGSARSTA